MLQTMGSRFRYPELDGLRGIAILMVIETHYHILAFLVTGIGLPQLVPLLLLGWSGVDLFFVLSGFLLGGILLDNKGASNYFRVFYTRRVCRIFPLYFLVVIPLLIIPPPLGLGLVGSFFGESLPSWTYLTYTQNFAMAEEGRLGTAWLAPTWSLAVEEQFYLILPFLIRFVSREKLPYLLAGLILAATLSRLAILAFHPHGDFAFFVLLPSRAEPLLLGVLGAWAVRNERCLNFLLTRRRFLYGVLALLTMGAALLALGPYSSPPQTFSDFFPPTYGFALLGLLYVCALLIAVTEKRGLVSFVTRNRLLGKVGIIAYGMYLLHLPILLLLFWLVPQRYALIAVLGALLLTFTLASISWIFFEKRIVNWGRSFRYENLK